MIIDIHTHIMNPKFDIDKIKLNFYSKIFLKKLQLTTFDEYLSKLMKTLNESAIDKAVLIALENTTFNANNEQVVEICKQNPKFLYGANLNPKSENIEAEFSKAIENKAVLFKLIPSFQNVNPSDVACKKFYELLKKHDKPLLVHTGIEHTLKTKNQQYNNPGLLEYPAKLGVKIICAHCATPMYLHEKSYFNEWKSLTLNYENVYGDLSGMISPVRNFYLKKILKNPILVEKVLFGTDYPAFPVWFFQKTQANIMDAWHSSFKKIGFNDTIFTRANKVLNL